MRMLAKIGLAVGALVMQTLDGHEIVVSNYSDRVGTLIVFMSSRSSATQTSINAIAELGEKYRRKGVLFVGVFPNRAETREEILAFCQSRRVRFPIYRDVDGSVVARLGARFTPEAFLIDAKGVLVYHGGFLEAEAAKDLDEAITRLRAGEPLTRTEFPAAGTPIDDIGVSGDASPPGEPIAFSSEVIFEKIDWAPDHHCSTITEAPNGDLLCVWFGGSFECADDQALFLARRKHGERAWTAPERFVTGPPLHPPGNAVVFRAGPGRVGLLWDRMDAPRPIRSGHWGEGALMFRYSDDNGHTWSEDRELTGVPGGLRNPPLTLQSGELIVPVSGGQPGFIVTRDQGATWETLGFIDTGGRSAGQPAVVQRSDGSLLALLRCAPHIIRSESRDNGKTWSATSATSLSCPHSGISMCRLRNGHLAVVFNDSVSERTPLSIALSMDEGETWSPRVTLESNPGEYSYPCAVQTPDERIHVTYTFLRRTIKHAELSEEWIRALMPMNEGG